MYKFFGTAGIGYKNVSDMIRKVQKLYQRPCNKDTS